MAITRDKSFKIDEDGLLLDGGAHLSSGSGAPTHTGNKGDYYFDVTNNEVYNLKANGSSWTRLSPAEEQADGFTVEGGTTSARTLELNSGNVEIQGAGSATITFPSSTSTLATTSLAETLENKIWGSGTKVAIGSDATGDFYYRDSSGNFTRFAIGTNGQYLTVSGGLPAWTSGSVPDRAIVFSSGPDSVTADRWLGFGNADTTEAHVARIMPAGTITAIYCHRENTSGDGRFEIYKNGSIQSSANTTITSGNTTNNTGSLSISFNGTTDLISIKVVEATGPISGNYKCTIYYTASSP